MSKRKSTIRRTNSAETFPNVQEYNRQRNMLGLPGHHELSVLAENPSYMTTLNDSIPPNSGKKDNLQYHREELANLQRELNEQREAERNLDTVSHGSEVYAPTPIRITQAPPMFNLPPAPGSKKSSSRKSKKEPSLFEPPTILKRQPFSGQTQTFTILNPRATRRTKLPKKKSKGGKNKTKKRKTKKTKKNKKNKK